MIELAWDTLSQVLTPASLHFVKSRVSADSLVAFENQKDKIIVDIFRNVLNRFASECKMQTFFENYLSKEGFIPKYTGSDVSNDVFGYVNSYRQWTEWNMFSVEVIRMYWDRLFYDLSVETQTQLKTICMSVLKFLPGNSCYCESCQWTVPESAMYSVRQCNYCNIKSRDGILKSYHNCDYIFIPTLR